MSMMYREVLEEFRHDLIHLFAYFLPFALKFLGLFNVAVSAT
jgi:hypothetical protein